MRGQIINTLRQRMAEDKSLFFLTGDMGINLVEVIEKQFPDRFVNVGIAEQNLIGVAAGLCNAGFRPVAYTISNFLVHRCFEQVRNDIVLHEYPVILLGTSAGFDNASLGPTHHIIDEWGALKGLPGMKIYTPSSVEFALGVLDRALSAGGPSYIRVAKGEPKILAVDEVSYLPGKTQGGPLFVSYGTLASECVKAQAERDDLSVLVFNRVHPLAPAVVAQDLVRHRPILVVEDHFGHTGLYGSLCQLAMEQRLVARIESAAPPLGYDLVVGQSGDVYHRRFGLDAASLLRRIGVREKA